MTAIVAAGITAAWFAPTGFRLPAGAALNPPSPPPHPRSSRILAPVVDISTSVEDIDGFALTQTTATSVFVRLDASVLFDKDSARVRPQSRTRLRGAVAELRRAGPGDLTVTGYTDDLGSARHGLNLSRRRAAAVAEYLASTLPAAAYPTKVIGRGEADPAVPNTSEPNRAKNRRVTILYTAARP